MFFHRAYKSEYRKKFRPFSQYQYVDGKFHKVKGEETAAAGGSESPNNWYKEVIELRRQAGQYRVGVPFWVFAYIFPYQL